MTPCKGTYARQRPSGVPLFRDERRPTADERPERCAPRPEKGYNQVVIRRRPILAATWVAMSIAMCIACEPSRSPEDAKEPKVSTARPLRASTTPPVAAPPTTPIGNRRTPDLPPTDAVGAVDGGARPTRPDADVVRDIERNIRENSILSAQGAKVRVSCERGEVTMRGTVKDEAAHASVTAMVRQTPGVLRISDLLKALDPHPTDWNPDDPKY